MWLNAEGEPEISKRVIGSPNITKHDSATFTRQSIHFLNHPHQFSND